LIRFFIGLVLGIFLFLIIGSIILEQFPSIVPIWEEGKGHIVALYNMSLVKYGAITTFLIIIALFVVFGSSKRI